LDDQFGQQAQVLPLIFSHVFEIQPREEFLFVLNAAAQHLHVVSDLARLTGALKLVASETAHKNLVVLSEEQLREEVPEPLDLDDVAHIKLAFQLCNCLLVAPFLPLSPLVTALALEAAAQVGKQGSKEKFVVVVTVF